MSSPSLMHEGVIALVRDRPAFAANLLRDLLHVDVPRFDEAQLMEAEGKAEGKAEDLVKILRRRGMVLTDEQQQSCACTDLATLDRWLDRAFSATSVDEVLTKSL